MQAARYYGPEDVRIEEVEKDPVAADDVRIEVHSCGICGSDLGEYVGGRRSDRPVLGLSVLPRGHVPPL